MQNMKNKICTRLSANEFTDAVKNDTLNNII